MTRTATKPQSAKIQNVVVDDRINYALTIQDKYRKLLKTYSTDQSRVTPADVKQWRILLTDLHFEHQYNCEQLLFVKLNPCLYFGFPRPIWKTSLFPSSCKHV